MKPARTISDKAALDLLQRAFSGTLWDGAADFLDWTAGVIQQTGREVKEAGQRARVWKDTVDA